MQTFRPPVSREWGAWGMALTPAALALLTVGPSIAAALLAFTAWVLGYSGRGAVEVLTGTSAGAALGPVDRRAAWLWLGLVALPAGGIGLWLLIARPQLIPLMAALLLLGAGLGLMVARGLARSLLLRAGAAVALSWGAPFVWIAARGGLDRTGWALWASAVAFFLGSVLRVRSRSRERRNPVFRLLSPALHGLMAAGLFWLLPAAGLAFLPAALWALYTSLGQPKTISLAVIGKQEMKLVGLWTVLSLIGLLLLQ